MIMGKRRYTNKETRAIILEHRRRPSGSWHCHECGEIMQDVRDVIIDHKDHNPQNNELINLWPHCRACSTKQGGKLSAEKRSSGAYVCDIKTKADKTWEKKQNLGYSEGGTGPMKANAVYEPQWIDFVTNYINTKGSITEHTAKLGAAAFLGCSSETSRRYLETHSEEEFGFLTRKRSKSGEPRYYLKGQTETTETTP